jgi:nanoRNase/pAp phosphatase (c-di-AMP/oligoRNAs hydrolase)
MALSTFQQAQEFINRSKNTLIVLPRNPSLDAISSSLGLFLVLEKLGKNSKIVCNEFTLPPNAGFLPKSEGIHTSLSSLRKFVISLDVSRTAVEELSYEIQDNKLQIYITPRNGYFEERDVTTSAGSFTYDLVVILESPDLESLGRLYDDNTEFFYRTPVVNIDHSPSNELYGQVNIVEVTAASTSEIVFELIKSLGENLLDEHIATNLLAGVISKTKSFQTPSVTPKSLAVASHLIASGARRDEIIKNLYQTKSLATLKLWGRALARLRSTEKQDIVWSLLSREDFIKSGAQVDELPGVVDELIVNTPVAKAVFILYEYAPGVVRGIIHTPAYVNDLDLFKDYAPKGTQDFTQAEFKGRDLAGAEQLVLDMLKPRIK